MIVFGNFLMSYVWLIFIPKSYFMWRLPVIILNSCEDYSRSLEIWFLKISYEERPLFWISSFPLNFWGVENRPFVKNKTLSYLYFFFLSFFSLFPKFIILYFIICFLNIYFNCFKYFFFSIHFILFQLKEENKNRKKKSYMPDEEEC